MHIDNIMWKHVSLLMSKEKQGGKIIPLVAWLVKCLRAVVHPDVACEWTDKLNFA